MKNRRWKQILVAMLTLAMLAQNSFSILASEDVAEKKSTELVQVLGADTETAAPTQGAEEDPTPGADNGTPTPTQEADNGTPTPGAEGGTPTPTLEADNGTPTPGAEDGTPTPGADNGTPTPTPEEEISPTPETTPTDTPTPGPAAPGRPSTPSDKPSGTDEDEGSEPGNEEPPEETTVTYESTETGVSEISKASVTMTGVDLPDSDKVTLTVMPASGPSAGDKNLWVDSFYKIELRKEDGTLLSISENSAVKLEFDPAAEVGVMNPDKHSRAVYELLQGTGADLANDETAAEAVNANGYYLESIEFQAKENADTFGIRAYLGEISIIRLEGEKIIESLANTEYKTGITYFDEEQNEWIPLENAASVQENAKINVTVCFSISDVLIKGDQLEYELPENVTSTDGQTGEIHDGNGTVIASYRISTGTNGRLKAVITPNGEFYTSDIAYGVKGFIQFTGSLNVGEVGEEGKPVTIMLGTIPLQITVIPKVEEVRRSIELEKSVEMTKTENRNDGFMDRLIYTLTVTAPAENSTDLGELTIEDTFIKNTSGNPPKDGGDFVTADPDWTGPGGDFETAESGIFYKLETPRQEGEAALELKVIEGGKNKDLRLSSLKPGEKVTIQYAVKVEERIAGFKETGMSQNSVSHVVVNTASVRDGSSSDTATVSASAEASAPYSKTWLLKKAKIDNANQITYTITANDKPMFDLTGWTFKDELGKDQGQKFKEITVTWTDADGNKGGTERWSASDGGTGSFNVPDDRQSFTWPAKDGAYKYEFTCVVELTGSNTAQNYTNKIQLWPGQVGTGTWFETGVNGGGVVYNQYNVTKKVTGINIAENTIDWDATMYSEYGDAHREILNGSVFTDTLIEKPDKSEKPWTHYFTEDQFDAIYVKAYNPNLTNLPEAQRMVILDPQYYKKTAITDKNGRIAGFTLTLGGEGSTPIQESEYRMSVQVFYQTTVDLRESSDDVMEYRNQVEYSGKRNWWSHLYTFSSLLKKEVSAEKTNLDEKTVAWKMTVNGGAVRTYNYANKTSGLTNITIKDILPKDADGKNRLECIGIEGGDGKVVWNESADAPEFTIEDCSKQTITFYVLTKIKESFLENREYTYTNEAELYVGGQEESYGKASATYTVKNTLFDKTGDFTDTNGRVNYALEINSLKETLIPDVENATIYIVDDMGENMVLMPDSVKVKKINSANAEEEISGWSVVPVEGDESQFMIIGLPDRTHLRITYEVMVNEGEGEVSVSNFASLMGNGKSLMEDEKQGTIKIDSSSAGLQRELNLTLLKLNKADSKPMKGVTFTFGEAQYLESEKKFSYSPVKENLVTGEDGKIVIDNSLYPEIKADKYYYYQETGTWDGYKLDGTPKVFCITSGKASGSIPGVVYRRNGMIMLAFNEREELKTELQLTGTKKVDDKTADLGAYSFVITADKVMNGETETNKMPPLYDNLGQLIPGGKKTVQNDAEGKIDFGTFKFLEKDAGNTFIYKIREVIPEEAERKEGNLVYNGIVYDEQEYTVSISVTKDETTGKAVLRAACTVNGEAYSSELLGFANNTYRVPTAEPTAEPTEEPTGEPTGAPTGEPTGAPTGAPTGEPTGVPTTSPTEEPTPTPEVSPTPELTPTPELSPTPELTLTPEPSLPPTEEPASTPGSITVIKNISSFNEDMSLHDIIAKEYRAYVGIFTDPEGEVPYEGDFVREIPIHNGYFGSATFGDLPEGTYYIFETDAEGNRITYDDIHEVEGCRYICILESGSNRIEVNEENGTVEGDVAMSNIFFDLPEGFAYRAYINITKKVVKNGETVNTDDAFYAGIFTRDSDGEYVLLEDMILQLAPNDTITVEVPLGGEDGKQPVTYYVAETDAKGNPVSLDEGFPYEVSGKGSVTLNASDSEASVTIVNEIPVEEPTEEPTKEPTKEPEEKKDDKPEEHKEEKKTPATGDSTNMLSFFILLTASAVVMFLLYTRRRINHQK